jgi:hypothetical protein
VKDCISVFALGNSKGAVKSTAQVCSTWQHAASAEGPHRGLCRHAKESLNQRQELSGRRYFSTQDLLRRCTLAVCCRVQPIVSV